MRNRNRIALSMFASLLAGSAKAQVDIAVTDVAKGAERAVVVESKCVLRTVGGVAYSVPVAVGTAVVSGVVAGTTTFAVSIANSSAKIALTEGSRLVKTSVIASTSAAEGILKAGWHAAVPRRRTALEAPLVETDDEKEPLKDITSGTAKAVWHHLFRRNSGDDDNPNSGGQAQ